MTVLSVILSLMMAALSVQQPSLFDSFRQKVSAGCVFVDYEYSVIVSGIKTTGTGEIYVQGNAYNMKGDGVEVYCDGVSTWLIDKTAGEVVIESATSDEAGFLANPILILMNIESNSQSYQVNGNVIDLVLEDGTPLKIVVSDIKSVDEKKMEDFRPPYKFDADWIVTDLR